MLCGIHTRIESVLANPSDWKKRCPTTVMELVPSWLRPLAVTRSALRRASRPVGRLSAGGYAAGMRAPHWMLTDFLYAYTYGNVNDLEYRSLSEYRRFNIHSKESENSNIRYIRETFDYKFCNRTGIARSEGRGQGQRNKLCLAAVCPCEFLHSKGSDKIYKKKNGITMNSGLIFSRPIVPLFGSTHVC